MAKNELLDGINNLVNESKTTPKPEQKPQVKPLNNQQTKEQKGLLSNKPVANKQNVADSLVKTVISKDAVPQKETIADKEPEYDLTDPANIGKEYSSYFKNADRVMDDLAKAYKETNADQNAMFEILKKNNYGITDNEIKSLVESYGRYKGTNKDEKAALMSKYESLVNEGKYDEAKKIANAIGGSLGSTLESDDAIERISKFNKSNKFKLLTDPQQVVTRSEKDKWLKNNGLDKYFYFDGGDLVDAKTSETLPVNINTPTNAEKLFNEIVKYIPKDNNEVNAINPEQQNEIDEFADKLYDDETKEALKNQIHFKKENGNLDYTAGESFEKKIPHNMRYKQWDVVDDNDGNDVLFWVTQQEFDDADVEKFKEALKETGLTKAYVIVRDFSTYDFEKDAYRGMGTLIDINENDDELDLTNPETKLQTADVGTIVQEGSEFQTKNGNKIKVGKPTIQIGLDGEPYIDFEYEYELVNGQKGKSKASWNSLYKMLTEN